MLCMVYGNVCTFLYQKPYSGIPYSIISDKTLPYIYVYSTAQRRCPLTRRLELARALIVNT